MSRWGDHAGRGASRSSSISARSAGLAWILSKQPHAHVIPGMRRETHLQANWDGASSRLDDARIAALDQLFALDAVQGARYTAQGYVGIESPRR